MLKQIRGTDLVGAVRTVAAGQSMLDPGTRDHFIRISPVMLNGRHLRTDSTWLTHQPR